MLEESRTVTDVDGSARDPLFRSVCALTLLNSIIYIWRYRFLPISDYPDWVFEGSILARLFRGEIVPQYTIKHYPVPYAGVAALLGVFDLALPPELSGKVLLTTIILFFAFSSVYLLKSLKRDEASPALYLPILFLFNTFFFSGELFYLVGLIVLFFYCGYLIRHLDNSSSIKAGVVLGYTIVLFFSHFITYAIGALITGVLLAFHRDLRLWTKVVLASLPSMALTVWYAFERMASGFGDGPIWKSWTIHNIVGRVLGAFSPFPEFLPWLGVAITGMRFVSLLNLVVCLAVLSILPFCVGAWSFRSKTNTSVLACSLLCIIGFGGAGYAFAGMISPGERFLYPAVWLALCWLVAWRARHPHPIANVVLKSALIGLILAQALYLDIYGGMVSHDLARLYADLRAAKSRTEFCHIYNDYVSRSWDKPKRHGYDRFLTNHPSVPRLPYYIYLEDRQPAPIFEIGLLDYQGPGDNENLCR